MKIEVPYTESVRVFFIDPIFSIELTDRFVLWKSENGWETAMEMREFIAILEAHRDKRDGHLKQHYEKKQP